jgi:hypothetical protein
MPDGGATKEVVLAVPEKGKHVVFEEPRPDPKNHKKIVHVKPPSFHLGSEPHRLKEVVWENHTGADVIFWFPSGAELFDDNQNGIEIPHTIPAGESHSLKVKDSPTDGDYHYHVYCKATGDCAHGHSEPGGHCP